MRLDLKNNHTNIVSRIFLSFPFFLLGYYLSVFLWKYISLPSISGFPFGIVSYTTRNEINPLNDYLRLILLIVISTGMLLWGFNRGYLYLSSFLSFLLKFIRKFIPTNAKKRGVSSFWEYPELYYSKFMTRWEKVSIRGKYSVLILMISIIFFNVTWNDLTPILEDGFHDGEILGYLPTINEGGGIFEKSFIIHGLGINIFPSIVGEYWADTHNRIYFTRLYSLGTSIISFIFLFLSIASAVQIYLKGKTGWSKILLVSFLILCALKFTFFWNILVRGRDALLFIQLFILLQLLYSLFNDNRQRLMLLSLLAGFILPIGFLNAYDRAIVATLALLFTLFLILFFKKGVWKIHLLVTVGFVLSFISIYLLLGRAEVSAAMEQISYWSRTAGLIWDVELTTRSLLAVTIYALQNIFIISLALVILYYSFVKSEDKIEFLQKNSGFFILTIISLIFLRMSADRSDTNHLFDSTLPSILTITFLLTVFVIQHLPSNSQPKITTTGSPNSRIAVMIVFVSVLFSLIYSNPYISIKRSSSFVSTFGRSDSLILAPKYLEAGMEMMPLIKNEKSFYTLTSEGIWYYIFDLPSTSRFHQMLYARTKELQMEVVSALEQNRPGYILFSNNYFSSELDSVSIFNSNHLITSFVLENYKPFKMINNQWFWKFDTSGFIRSKEIRGKVFTDTITATMKKDSIIEGELITSTDSNYSVIYMTSGINSKLEALTLRVTPSVENYRWSFEIPTAILNKGDNTVQFWLMSNEATVLYPLGGKVIVKIQ